MPCNNIYEGQKLLAKIQKSSPLFLFFFLIYFVIEAQKLLFQKFVKTAMINQHTQMTIVTMQPSD
jgi:hypothetical protein